VAWLASSPSLLAGRQARPAPRVQDLGREDQVGARSEHRVVPGLPAYSALLERASHGPLGGAGALDTGARALLWRAVSLGCQEPRQST